MENLLNQPWSTVLLFVGGYISYHIANTGIRDHHKTIDITFSTLVFGFFSVFLYETLTRVLSIRIDVASLAAVFGAILIGAFWRLRGREWYQFLLRKTNVSESDDIPSAWLALFDQTKYDWTQISVKTKDNKWLYCKDMRLFIDKPNGPCTLGPNGDVLMYVTGTGAEDGEEVDIPEVVDPHWGDNITYIPASEIKLVDIRRRRKP